MPMKDPMLSSPTKERRGSEAPRRDLQPSWLPGITVRSKRSYGVRHEFALDVLMLVVAAGVAHLSSEASGSQPAPTPWVLSFSAIVVLGLALSGAYRPRFVPHFLDDVRSVLGATAIAAMVVTFARVLTADDPHIATQEARAWLFAATYVIAGRGGFQLVQSRARRRGEVAEPTLIVGAGKVGRLIATRLRERPEFGLRPVGFFDENPLEMEDASDLPVYPSANDGDGTLSFADGLELAIRDLEVRHVIVTFSLAPHDVELSLVRRCEELGVSVSLVPRLFEGVPDQTTLERLGGIPLISVHPRNPKGWQFAAKYALDRVFAALALLLVSPVFLMAALGTLVTLGRPVLFRQPRVGIDGHRFEMLKFRTMAGSPEQHGEADADWAAEALGREREPAHADADAERTTRFGAVLRKFSIDELPQLLNVLRGEMSLIGPRPERIAYVREFNRAVHRYGDRHRVKSGLTGWAQVHGLRGKTSLSDRVEWDNYYIENWSPWLDIKIVALTLVAIFRDPAP
jgi:exopolysaccharide biosynthesis polyprenyl glycosylphosphotransferase